MNPGDFIIPKSADRAGFSAVVDSLTRNGSAKCRVLYIEGGEPVSDSRTIKIPPGDFASWTVLGDQVNGQFAEWKERNPIKLYLRSANISQQNFAAIIDSSFESLRHYLNYRVPKASVMLKISAAMRLEPKAWQAVWDAWMATKPKL